MNEISRVAAVGVLIALPFAVAEAVEGGSEVPTGPADAIVATVADDHLRVLLTEVLARNPEIATHRARMAAAGHRSTAARKLPDPRAELTAFVLPPETRVGPQRAAARVTQAIPGGGKRDAAAAAAELERQALEAEIEAIKLKLVTRARRLAVELGYLAEANRVLIDELGVLAHYEELARARYSAGSGLQMDAVRIQAEMTRLETRISGINERRAAVAADLNLLRDRSGVVVAVPDVEVPSIGDLDWSSLTEVALVSRPELAASTARIDRAAAFGKLAAKERSPDFSVGLTYAWVDTRTDVDVPDNGRDIFGISGGVTIPLWSTATDAEVAANTEDRLAREASHRAAVAGIRRQIEALAGRIPEIRRRLALLEDVLPVQSAQALTSVEAAYSAGRADALELLEAERTLLDVRLSAARGRADLAQALIELEGAIGSSIIPASGGAQ
ncbi:MAG: TolC family protein [Thermoanaerobaculales bacterium]|jgi:outer membrane protein TolC|nr:TolC family protein [Thermoanaerobaculales bacterium]